MVRIIPNWHPVFVHFTLGLLLIATALYLVILFLPENSRRRSDLILVANWNLWIGYAFALVTAWFGWRAFNTVAHDSTSHAAMIIHRNWALATLLVYFPVVAWSMIRAKTARPANWPFMIILLVPAILLSGTGWRGAELVYRHGLGVMSLPQSEDTGHSHGDNTDNHVHEENHEHMTDHHHELSTE